MKYYLVFVLILLSFANGKPSKRTSIKFEYAGSILDKPMPTLVFTTDKSSETDFFYKYIFLIRQSDFDSICQFIETNKKLFRSSITSCYEVSVYNSSDTTAYYVKDRTDMKIAFKRITHVLKDYEQMNEIEEEMNEIIARIR